MLSLATLVSQLSGGGNYLAFDVGIVTVKDKLGGIYLKLPAVGVGAPVGKQLLAGAWGYTEPNVRIAYATMRQRRTERADVQTKTLLFAAPLTFFLI